MSRAVGGFFCVLLAGLAAVPLPAFADGNRGCKWEAVRPTPPPHAMLLDLHVSVVGCGKVRCEVSRGMMGSQAQVNVSGADFSAYEDRSLAVSVFDLKTQKVVERHFFGGSASGSAWIDASLLPDGEFIFVISPPCDSTVLAAGKLSVGRSDPHADKRKGGGGAGDAAEVVGTWYGTARTVGTIDLRPDGTYTYGGAPAGNYRVVPGGIRFTGSLSAWNGGQATLSNGNLEFYWTNAQGAKQWFSFAKGN